MNVGDEFGPSDWLEITQERIDRFAEATDDHQWIHVDPEQAAQGPFGTTIAHGFLTLSLVVPMFAEALPPLEGYAMTLNYGLNRVRFPAPLPVGSRVRLRATLSAIEDLLLEERLELVSKLVHFFKPTTGFHLVAESSVPAGAAPSSLMIVPVP